MAYQRLRFISGIILVIVHIFWLDLTVGLLTGTVLMGASNADSSAVLLFTLGAVGILLSSCHQKWLLLTTIANIWSYLFILSEIIFANHSPFYMGQLTTSFVLGTTSFQATIAHITAGIIASVFIFFAAFQNLNWKILGILGKYPLAIAGMIYGSINIFMLVEYIMNYNYSYDIKFIIHLIFFLLWIFNSILLILSDKNLYAFIFQKNKLYSK